MRLARGQSTTEFAAATTVIVMFLMLSINLGAIPLRYFLIKQLVHNTTRNLALCKKGSDCATLLASDTSFKRLISQLCGSESHKLSLDFVVTSADGKCSTVFKSPRDLPAEMLLGRSADRPSYTLRVHCDVLVSPAWTTSYLFNAKIPGITEPIAFRFTESARFENVEIDPATKIDFIAE